MGRKVRLVLAGIAAAGAILLLWRLDLPNWQRLDLNRIYAQPRSTVVLDASGEPVGALSSGVHRVWLPLEEIPVPLQNAFIAAEDQRFHEHCGISLRRIAAAALHNLRSLSRSQGASTITQQLIKLTHLSGEKTLSRKAQEAVLALRLERQLSKEEILECYLNTVYFGRGAYGVAAAAKTYFGKEVSGLTLAESALLAGIIKAPSVYAPYPDAEKSLKRRDLILGEMEECGFVTPEQAAAAKAEPLSLALPDDESENGWYMDATLSEAAQLLDMEPDALLTAGLTVQTAFDPALQAVADSLFLDGTRFPADAADRTPVQAAFVAMDPATGEIRALIGGRSYEVRRGLNRATQIRRSPGSAIKPVSVCAAAIDAFGFTPASFLEDVPREFDGGYTPGNAGGRFYGTVTLREALSRSLNVAIVDLADLIGADAVREYALRFGLPLSPQDESLALALGSMTYGVSPAELCAAYAALANGGTQVSPHLIRRITAPDGSVLYEAEAPSRRAVQEATAYMLTDMLATAVRSGSAKALSAAGMPVAAKTGTVSDADGSTRDLWTAAFTPDLAVTVWMGFDEPGGERRLSGSEGGSGFPARLCSAFLSGAADRLGGTGFARPDTVRTALLDAVSLGKGEIRLATGRTPSDSVVAELFPPDGMPTEYSAEWSAPEAIRDLTLISGRGETPVLQFTALSDNAEYLLIRTDGSGSEIVAVLSGEKGETLRHTDTEADLRRRAEYTVIPRNRLLSERGELLAGPECEPVRYTPTGLAGLLPAASP